MMKTDALNENFFVLYCALQLYKLLKNAISTFVHNTAQPEESRNVGMYFAVMHTLSLKCLFQNMDYPLYFCNL